MNKNFSIQYSIRNNMVKNKIQMGTPVEIVKQTKTILIILANLSSN